jgi:hypothetical protein
VIAENPLTDDEVDGILENNAEAFHPLNHLCHSPYPSQYLNVQGFLAGAGKIEYVLPSYN